MMVRVTVGKRVVNVVSAYAPQAGRSYSEKEEFWCSMMMLLSSLRDEESILVGGDLNGHVGRDRDGFEEVHGGNGFGKRKLGRRDAARVCDGHEINRMQYLFYER